MISAEWCAFTNFPWGRGPINFEEPERDRAMATYRAWLRLFRLLPFYSWIVDRFHLSTRAYQTAAHGADVDFSWLEEGLAELGFRIVLCTRTANSFAAARQERIQVSGKPSQYDDLGVFVEEQERFRELAERSRLPVLELDVSDGDVAGACSRVADWLEADGGLHAPDEIGEIWRKESS